MYTVYATLFKGRIKLDFNVDIGEIKIMGDHPFYEIGETNSISTRIISNSKNNSCYFQVEIKMNNYIKNCKINCFNDKYIFILLEHNTNTYFSIGGDRFYFNYNSEHECYIAKIPQSKSYMCGGLSRMNQINAKSLIR